MTLASTITTVIIRFRRGCFRVFSHSPNFVRRAGAVLGVFPRHHSAALERRKPTLLKT